MQQLDVVRVVIWRSAAAVGLVVLVLMTILQIVAYLLTSMGLFIFNAPPQLSWEVIIAPVAYGLISTMLAVLFFALYNLIARRLPIRLQLRNTEDKPS